MEFVILERLKYFDSSDLFKYTKFDVTMTSLEHLTYVPLFLPTFLYFRLANKI